MILRALLPFAFALAACSEADNSAALRDDTATVNAIADLAGAASCAAKAAGGTLPNSITEIKASLDAHAATVSPDCTSYTTGWDMHAIKWRGLALTRQDDSRVQICADFKLSSDQVPAPARFPELADKREAGRHCFLVKIDA